MGISLDVDLISDQFNTKMAVPELDIDARDSGFKTGSFILYNNLLNCGDKYKNNLMVGLQPLKEKSLNIGKQASIIFAALVGVSIVVAGGYYAFLNIQKSMDEAKLKEDKYVQAKDLLARQEAIQTKLKNQVSDSKNLPQTPLSSSDHRDCRHQPIQPLPAGFLHPQTAAPSGCVRWHHHRVFTRTGG